MALMVLGKDDFPGGSIPSIVTQKAAELLTPSDPRIQGPRNLKLEAGQTNDDLCNTIDLPAATFATVAPASDDLPFLAHVREVKTGGKETLSLKQDGWFAVVLANRLPATSKDGKGKRILCVWRPSRAFWTCCRRRMASCLLGQTTARRFFAWPSSQAGPSPATAKTISRQRCERWTTSGSSALTQRCSG
jgi:hypothetical protein